MDIMKYLNLCIFALDVFSLFALPGPFWTSRALQVPATWGRACTKVCFMLK